MLSNEVEDLLWKSALDHVTSEYYSTYFLVPKNDSGLRTILNLKFFNLNICKTLFKREMLRSIMAVVRLHQWMASVDLKDKYFHIPLVAVHDQFLRFSWLGTSYQFGILLFGISSAPRLFTKTLAHVIVWLRLFGIQLYVRPGDGRV